jgi:phenylpropionate dioxygenase-like ring-hydroxylating dioxygenase large terminal subunit
MDPLKTGMTDNRPINPDYQIDSPSSLQFNGSTNKKSIAWRVTMYPKNTWYVACTPDEIAKNPGPADLRRKMVFYRGHEGAVVAVEDFCPHRGAPLSLGYVENGNLVCGYHGLVMGCDGKTVSCPASGCGFSCNKTFAAVERWLHLGVARRPEPGRPGADPPPGMGGE